LHYLQARQPQLAHYVAMNELAIEAILRDDLALLGSLFRLFNPNEISDWSYRGKVCICNVRLATCSHRTI
jgi:nuclear pore complex protein Nup98-Nup96